MDISFGLILLGLLDMLNAGGAILDERERNVFKWC